MAIVSCVRLEMSPQEQAECRARHPDLQCEKWRIRTDVVEFIADIIDSGCIPRITRRELDPERQAYLVELDASRRAHNPLVVDVYLWWKPIQVSVTYAQLSGITPCAVLSLEFTAARGS